MKTKICNTCNIDKKEDDFYIYKTKSKPRIHEKCKECVKVNASIRNAIYKELCVKYKGGKCEICGYDKYIGALDFHHRDPSLKKFNIALKSKLQYLNSEITEELDKCQILCANCHRETHNVHDIEQSKNTFAEYQKQKHERSNLRRHKKITCSCGNIKNKNSKQCLKCKNKKALERNIDEVISKVKETNWTQAGKFFGVSGAALRQFLKNREIDIYNL